MEPDIKTGSLVLVMEQSDYRTGDVITYTVPGGDDTVTHRIVEKKTDMTNSIFYRVKGDANDAPDKELVSKSNVVGEVLFSIPLLGYLVAFIKTLPGLILFIVIPATIIVYQELVNIKAEIQKLRRAKNHAIETAKKVEDIIVVEEKKLAKKFRTKGKRNV
jgi:signal peptidase